MLTGIRVQQTGN